MSGRFIGIGVGPGDPELLTLKAVNALHRIDCLAYLASSGRESMAHQIVRKHLPEGLEQYSSDAPMREGPEARNRFYDEFADTLRSRMKKGDTVGILCLGDPMFYGSFIYVLARLREEFPFEIIPGITSVSAASARTGFAMGFSGQSLGIFPASLSEEQLETQVQQHDVCAILKVGRHLGKLKEILHDHRQLDRSLLLNDLGWIDEGVQPLSEVTDTPGYFSIVLTSRR